jgi:hypothetical protein
MAMKQQSKAVIGTALGVAAAAALAAGCSLACASMTVVYSVYGPPPDEEIVLRDDADDEDGSSTQTGPSESQSYDTDEANAYDPTENEPVEVYGPPEMFEDELLND